MPEYILTDQIMERLFYSKQEIRNIQKEFIASSTSSSRTMNDVGRSLSAADKVQKKKLRDHRRHYVRTILALQDEHRANLESPDEHGLRVFSAALSKQDQKKVLEVARHDALEAYYIYCDGDDAVMTTTTKSVDEYSKPTTSPTKFVPRSVALAGTSARPHCVLPKGA